MKLHEIAEQIQTGALFRHEKWVAGEYISIENKNETLMLYQALSDGWSLKPKKATVTREKIEAGLRSSGMVFNCTMNNVFEHLCKYLGL